MITEERGEGCCDCDILAAMHKRERVMDERVIS